jgi:hypothetical protein
MLKHTGQNIGLKFYLLILGAEKLASMLNIVLISCITRQEQSKDIDRMIRSLKSQTEQSPESYLFSP